jgi:hypothetical protein
MGLVGKVIIALVIVVAAAAVGADFAARSYAEHQLAKRIEQKVPGSKASVHISSFPFLGRLALQGRVSKLTANVTGVVAGTVRFSRVNLEVDGIRISRNRLFLHHQVVLERISRAIATADVSQDEIDRLTGLPVKLGAGNAQVTVAGVTLQAKASLAGGMLKLTANVGPTLSIPIPTLPVLPCATSVDIQPGQLQIRCVTTVIPPALLQAVGGG